MTNNTNCSEQYKAEYQKQKSQMKKPNLMIVGGTGVGKSSLINKVFGEEIAPVSSGEPVTKGVQRFENDHIPLVIYDSEGYEISQNGQDFNFIDVVMENIKQHSTGQISEQIHLIWYVVSVSNHRLTDYDLQNLTELKKRFPSSVAVVLSQCDQDKLTDDDKGETAEEFKGILKQKFQTVPIFETSTYGDQTFELTDLLNWSERAIKDEDLKRAFITAQLLDIDAKVAEAKRIVTYYAAGAGVAGAIPISGSDTPILIAGQMAMFVQLSQLFNMNQFEDLLELFLAEQLPAMMGRMLVAELTKIIPGLGSIISGSVASSITYGMGYAITEMYAYNLRAYLKTGREPDFMAFINNGTLFRMFEEGYKNGKN